MVATAKKGLDLARSTTAVGCAPDVSGMQQGRGKGWERRWHGTEKDRRNAEEVLRDSAGVLQRSVAVGYVK